MDTVSIEYMLVSEYGAVLRNWTKMEGSVMNDPQIYVPRAISMKKNMGTPTVPARVRVVSEQTNRVVDIFP